MSINGQIFGITDLASFFEPLLFGAKTPQGGFVSLKNGALNGASIIVNGYFSVGPFQFPILLPNSSFNATAGTFSVPDFNGLNIEKVSVDLFFHGVPLYRSQQFSYTRAKEGGLNIYINQPEPVSVTAGFISKALQGAGLPGNTQLSANPWGLGVSGSESEADIQFGISLVPDASYNLSSWVQLQLNGYDISVGWPESWCKSAHDILVQIENSLGSEDGTVNGDIKTLIKQVLQSDVPGNSAAIANDLFNMTSITFTSIVLPNRHQWALSATGDKTEVIAVHPTIGWPRGW